MAVTFEYNCNCPDPCTHVRFEGELYDDWREIVKELAEQRQDLVDYINLLESQIAESPLTWEDLNG